MAIVTDIQGIRGTDCPVLCLESERKVVDESSVGLEHPGFLLPSQVPVSVILYSLKFQGPRRKVLVWDRPQNSTYKEKSTTSVFQNIGKGEGLPK